jgi:hypothetical protein
MIDQIRVRPVNNSKTSEPPTHADQHRPEALVRLVSPVQDVQRESWLVHEGREELLLSEMQGEEEVGVHPGQNVFHVRQGERGLRGLRGGQPGLDRRGRREWYERRRRGERERRGGRRSYCGYCAGK